MKIPTYVAFIAGLFGISAHAGSPVWAIRGQHNTVYLAGSIHLLKTHDAKLPSAFDRAYAASEALFMELDLSSVDAGEMAGWMMEHGSLNDGKTLKDVLGAPRYFRVQTAASDVGLPMEMLDQMKPWVLGMELTEMQYAKLGFDPNQGVEQQLLRRAQSDRKDIQGLETLSEQLGALDGLSLDDQVKFLDLTLDEAKDMQKETDGIILAWRAGNTEKLASELGDEYKRFPTLYRVLVTERNRHWVPQIERLLTEQRNYLVVVGALHLVGEDGLLKLMRRDGFVAEELD